MFIKKHFISIISIIITSILFGACFSSPSSTQTSSRPTTPPPPPISYWKLDVVVDDFSRSGQSSTQTAYFFKELRHMNTLTGFPQGDFKTSYNWVQPLTGIPAYFNRIYGTMNNENFEAAYVLWGTGRNIYGESYWMYHVFLLRNGIGYYDGITRTNSPFRL